MVKYVLLFFTDESDVRIQIVKLAPITNIHFGMEVSAFDAN